MRAWPPERVARAAGARRVDEAPSASGPRRVVIDSRTLRPGDLFVGLVGEHRDGGAHGAEALAAGAWGVLVAPEHARGLPVAAAGVVLEHRDPLRALAALARAWRRELGAQVVAITGSTGKTSTKDILAALLSQRLRVSASPQNFNTAIGLPLAVLSAPAGTQALVLELAMRAPGEVAELTAVAEPDVGVIVNIGPVHLERLGSLEAVAAAKAELLAGLRAGATAVVPAGEPLLAPHLRADVRTVTFGDGGDVRLAASEPGGEVVISERATESAEAASIRLRPSFSQAHNLRNLLAAVAAARALGVTPDGELEVRFSALRGERCRLPDGAVLIDDCYNANPMSMRAAIDDLAETAPGRRVAVLGDMLELGPDARRFHREIGAHAAARGVDVLVTVGPLAAGMAAAFPGEVHGVDDAD
ncbi:MAG TPA: UDP-N-acetylmuramoyl-tripeptide--D-alanyl-D-alanine ligase, partial [Solirubrobacteraceae bacterium]|nr:UDP-N-acetylmuramoyl-tripeptide--D-alanyl-D-alanine ligase [Solirubrobacteraceae bacterium]